jgi:hypothetical protein
MHLDIDSGPGFEDLVVREPSSSPWRLLGRRPRADVSRGPHVRDTDRLR